EEAKAKGLESLGISESQAEITVVAEAVKGLFGKVKKEAVVDIKKKEEPAKETKREKTKKESVKTETADGGVKAAAEFIGKLFDIMDVNAKASITDGNVISLIAEDSSAVIGYRGEVLDAIQVLAGAVANIGKKEYEKIVVDCENYRDKREETLIALAHKLEAKATDMRRKVILEPMSPFERRIIHTALAESETVKTISDGKEPQRYVVIVPNDLDETSRPYNAGTNHGRNRRDGKSGGRNNHGRGDRGGRDFRNRGRGERKGSGFTEEKRKSAPSFGTYLGNSLKDKNY
ncbi:MAG: Jag N-terminal domain-containing protein, partial [Clostridia bacterium]|nr:Jag N-terminal domain-containing protein [Clostridia bacterium]